MSESSSDDDNDRRDSSHAAFDNTRERSATYAGTRCLQLLGSLRNGSDAGRIKALKNFQDYVDRHKPEFYDDDVDLLFLGSPSLDGLLAWAGHKHSTGSSSRRRCKEGGREGGDKGGGEANLKKVSKFALKLVHWLVVREGGREAGREGEESIFLEKFLELSENDLPQMELSMHVREGGREGGREDGAEALELLSLLLTRHKCTLPEGGKDGGGEGGGGGTEQLLLLLLPEEEVQLRFIQWLQQSASEEDLRERIERQRARREGGREGGGGGGGGEGACLGSRRLS
ncbi:hypothetical protein VYU27_010083 [Nannochloropsis oceanica]